VLHLRSLAAAYLSLIAAGCNSSSVLSPTPPAPHGSQTFHYTGEVQTFRVPSRVTGLTVTAYGARGDSEAMSSKPPPRALGAAVKATIPVTPGEALMVFVGGQAKSSSGGFNGGGNGAGGAPDHSYGGGGSSDVRTATGRLTDRIIVAGGGGGSGGPGFCAVSTTATICPGGRGGDGGTTVGGQGKFGAGQSGGGGAGGAVRAGGDGGGGGPDTGPSLGGSQGCFGTNGNPGSLLHGGTGAAGCGAGGGGGGGGYYGGGGGGSGGCCGDPTGFGAGGGGGGGSSFVEKSATNVKETPGGGLPGNGKIVITW
jgi:hypothetical protein